MLPLRLYLPLIVRHTDVPDTAERAQDEQEPAALPLACPAGASNVVTDTLIQYQYDYGNRLVAVTTWITVTGGESTNVFSQTEGYRYDAVGRRAGSPDVRYVYAGGRVIEERDPSDAIIATYSIGLTMDRAGQRAFYQVDTLGSIRALADETGNVTERVDYDPFGAPTFNGGGKASAMGNPYLFRATRYDAHIELYVQGGRRRDPRTGRFNQRGAEVLGNPYTFAGNNPVGDAP